MGTGAVTTFLSLKWHKAQEEIKIRGSDEDNPQPDNVKPAEPATWLRHISCMSQSRSSSSTARCLLTCVERLHRWLSVTCSLLFWHRHRCPSHWLPATLVIVSVTPLLLENISRRSLEVSYNWCLQVPVWVLHHLLLLKLKIVSCLQAWEWAGCGLQSLCMQMAVTGKLD